MEELYQDNIKQIEAVDRYLKIPIPELTVKVFTEALITPTNHLFINAVYVPTGITTPFDNKKLSFRNKIYFFTKYRFFTKCKKYNGVYSWAYDIFSTNYYHWLYEVLPRLLMIQKEHPEATIIVPISIKSAGFVEDSLKLLNLKWIWIDSGQTNIFKKLITVLTNPPIGNVVNSSLMHMVRTTIFEKLHYNKPNNEKRKVFISRAKTKYRRIQNEEELISIVQELGYEVVLTENLSFNNQIELFSQTISLISLHGAGLSNMMFMPVNSKILELRNQNWEVQPLCYFGLADVFHLYWDYLLAEPNKEESNFNDIRIDADLFKQKVQEFDAIKMDNF